MKCYDCPRECGVDRTTERGFCGANDKIAIAKIIKNFMWEEPCISGSKGALAIFFSGCNLRCDFCQNYKISHGCSGEFYTPEEFRKLINNFDLSKFSSIDLITPTHYSSFLCEALKDFKSPIPIVWNSSAYEKTDVIDKISQFVDVFLPDFKYFDNNLSKKLSFAENYFEKASSAILQMIKNKPQNIFIDGVLSKGVLIRHLVLPGQVKDSMKVLDFISKNVARPFISLMGQFTPLGKYFSRKLKPLEYKVVLNYALKLGLENGYFQELESASNSFIPKF